MLLFIFNPSQEIALACNAPSFTPNKAIKTFEKELALLPALYAPAGSVILLLHECDEDISRLPYHKIAHRRCMRIVSIRDLKSCDYRPMPWGWNKALRNQLLRAGIDPSCIPTEHEILKIREIASRSFTSAFWAEMAANSSCIDLARAPREVHSIEEARDILNRYDGDAVIKSIFSSSGRGVLFSAALPAKTVENRLVQLISAYGSAMIEPRHENILDFATEWQCCEGRVQFMGFSMFKTDATGHYAGNVVAPQEYFKTQLSKYTDLNGLLTTVEVQRQAIETIVAPHYSGPLGIDMLICANGTVNPCVEINLRGTMGHVAIHLSKLTRREFIFTPGAEIESYFENNS